MKVIRVSGCHDCLYPETHVVTSRMYCNHPRMMREPLLYVSSFIKNKILPDGSPDSRENCPLEDEATMEVYDCDKTTSGENITFRES